MFDMKKQLMWSKLKVGLVITTALIVILMTVFFAGSIENLFSPKITIYAQIKDVRGLRTGSPVWLSGVETGTVSDIKLNPEYGTLVTLSINRKAVPFIKKDSIATVMTMGLLGDKYVEISNGSDESGSIAPGDVIKGKVQLEIKDIVEATADSFSKVTSIVDKLSSLIEKVDRSEGSLGKFLTDPALYNNLKESTRSLSVALKEYEKSNGTLKQLIKDPSLYADAKDAAASMNKFSKQLNESQGSLKKLLTDPTLYDNLDKSSRQLSAVLADIESGKGTAGKMVKDQEMAEQLRQSIKGMSEVVAELKEITKDIKANPSKYFKFSVF